MSKPNFFIIGAAKAGTTSLAYYLSLQSQIFFSDPKELNFFCNDKLYPAKIHWYERHFHKVNHEIAIGEGSPTYTFCNKNPGSAQNIHNYNPNAKLIYLVRHPLERLQSHYLQILNNGYSARIPISKAIKQYPELLESSLYWKQISEYKKYFSNEQILILFFEELKADPNLTVKKCCQFLDVPFQSLPKKTYIVKNATKDHYEDKPILQIIKKIVPIKHPPRNIPKFIRNIGRMLLRQPQKSAPEWDEMTLHNIFPPIQEDLHHFFLYTQKPADYWKLNQN